MNHVSNKYGVNVKILFQFENEKDCICKEIELISKYVGDLLKKAPLSILQKVERELLVLIYIMSKNKNNLYSTENLYFYMYIVKKVFILKNKNHSSSRYCGVTYNAIHSAWKLWIFNGYLYLENIKVKN